jgi:hypothetical protein
MSSMITPSSDLLKTARRQTARRQTILEQSNISENSTAKTRRQLGSVNFGCHRGAVRESKVTGEHSERASGHKLLHIQH